jgi:hypothetical protein
MSVGIWTFALFPLTPGPFRIRQCEPPNVSELLPVLGLGHRLFFWLSNPPLADACPYRFVLSEGLTQPLKTVPNKSHAHSAARDGKLPLKNLLE